MFQSFFPRPKLFLLSALLWVGVAVALWYTQGEAMGAWFGFPPTDPAAEPVQASNEVARANITLADGSIGMQVTELRANESDLAHRQMQGRHLLCVEGEGYSLSFETPDSAITRTPWKRGVVIGQESMKFHQNVAGAGRARVMSIELGSTAAPIFRGRRAAYGDTSVYASGAATIERADESAELKAARGG